MLSVAVVVARRLLNGRPHLLFRGAALPVQGTGWESGSSSLRSQDCTGRRLTGKHTYCSIRADRCQMEIGLS